MRKKLLDSLMPATRQRLLALLLNAPDRWWYLSEIAEALSIGPSSLQRELDSLTAAAIVLLRRDGRRTYYRPNENGALYDELRSMFRKTYGISQEVGTALAPIEKQIALALVYGSVARGEERADSDVDLLVVADDLTLETLYRHLGTAEKTLHRKINPTLYTRDEFNRRQLSRNAFIERMLSGRFIILIGSIDDASPA